MIPFARFAHDWPEARGKFYNVIDPEDVTGKNESTISEESADKLMLPKVENQRDEEDLLNLDNLFSFVLR